MKQLIFALILISVFNLSAFAQAEKSSCPPVDISGGGMVETGTPANFTANVGGKTQNSDFRYEWKVSAGTISVGQGTPSITIDTAGLKDIRITVQVKVGGLPENCPNIAEETVGVIPEPPPLKPFDSWDGEISLPQEAARLNALMISLKDEWKIKSFIVLKVTEKTPLEQTRKRIRRMVKFAESRNLSKERLIFFVVKADRASTVLWIVPIETGTSECDNDADCRTIYGRDF